jgi:hypothetical protein
MIIEAASNRMRSAAQSCIGAGHLDHSVTAE